MINSGKDTHIIINEKIEVFPISNHEEADTSLIFHARMQTFLLLIYAYSSVRMFPATVVYEH